MDLNIEPAEIFFVLMHCNRRDDFLNFELHIASAVGIINRKYSIVNHKQVAQLLQRNCAAG